MKGLNKGFSMLRTGVLAAAVLATPAASLASGHATASNTWSVGMQDGLSFSVGASLGALNGDALERVWIDEVDYKLSELQWDLEGIWMLGLKGTVGITDRFRVNAGFWTAVNEGSGKMVDLDWLYSDDVIIADYMGLIDVTDDDWTHRSEHPDTTVDGINSFDINLDVRAFSMGGMHLNGIVGYKHDKFEWSARGGSAVYSQFALRDTIVDFEEGVTVIEYEQTYDVPYIGLGVDGNLGGLVLNAYLLYSPWVSATDRDYHALRDIVFEGDFSNGDYVALGVSGTYFFTANLFAGATVDYQDYSEMRGDVTMTDAPSGAQIDDPSKNGGSAALDSLMLSINAGWLF